MNLQRLFPIGLLLLAGCATTNHTTVEMHDMPLTVVKAKALEGDGEAIHDLCYRYIYGRKAARNYTEAREWCSKGADLGIDSSQTLLAEIYYFGHGVPVDYVAARRWYGAAADQGHEHALVMLYDMHTNGTGVPVDKPLADRALKLAVDAKYGPALEIQAEIDRSRDK